MEISELWKRKNTELVSTRCEWSELSDRKHKEMEAETEAAVTERSQLIPASNLNSWSHLSHVTHLSLLPAAADSISISAQHHNFTSLSSVSKRQIHRSTNHTEGKDEHVYRWNISPLMVQNISN